MNAEKEDETFPMALGIILFFSVECIYDLPKIKDLFTKARFARCRARFAVPVILYEGKHICRSATISGGAEIYGRSGFDFFFTGGESIPGE